MTVDQGLGGRTRTRHFGTRQDADYKHMKVKGTGGNNQGSVTHEEGQVT